MSEANNAQGPAAEFTEETTTTTTEETKPGFLGRAFNAVWCTPVKVVTGLAAVGGAGYVVYTKVRNGADAADVEDAVEVAAAAFRAVFK